MIKIIFILLLLLFATGFAMDPPAIVWTKNLFSESYGEFYDVHETLDGGFIVAGGHLLVGGGSANKSLYRFTHEGDTLWSAGAEGYEYQAGFWVEELADGSVVATGACGLAGAPTSSIMLFKADSDGNEIWSNAFDSPGTSDQGNCVIALEDGYAIAGDQGNKAWIIRTDLQGDSIWSATYEKSGFVNARRILQVDDTLIVFYVGVEVGILAYSIDDGQLLWGSDNFPADFGSVHDDIGDMTLSSSDNGFTMVTTYFPYIAHTDQLGNLLWHYEIPYWSQPYGYSINSTMDGGYIYGGENTEGEEPPYGIQAGMVVKYDSEGNIQWGDFVYETDVVKCIRQLSSGGYIACGGEGTAELIRYEPETGINSEEAAGSTLISLAPNPFSYALNIGFNLGEASVIELGVFDLTGRLVAEIEEGFFFEGEHSAVWAPEDIAPGCYLVRLTTNEGSLFRNCVYIH